MSLTKKIISLLIFNILAFGASAWGSYVTNMYKEPWYSGIVKPTFNPPDWVFAPVWIALYIAMSVAIWLMKLYYPINKLSSFLMVPYLMWLSYAFVLNFYIFILN